ncbi:hypothetical protein JNW90_24220 [Micromonospora sp. STR1s_5]|nr:hypothetical protein [Micromonospora sp. STR1s_5]
MGVEALPPQRPTPEEDRMTTYTAPALTDADVAIIRTIAAGDVVLADRTVGLVLDGFIDGWGDAVVTCNGGPLMNGGTRRFEVTVRAGLDILVPAKARKLPVLCPCVPLMGRPMCCLKPEQETTPDNQPTPDRIPNGATVTYRGSLREHHGQYRSAGRCMCVAECMDNWQYVPFRYELHHADGRVLEHVSRESIDYRAQ